MDSSDDERVTCQRQSSLFEVEKVKDTEEGDQEFLNQHLLCVELKKTAEGFGLTIEGGTDRPLYAKDNGIFITHIKTGSNAHKCQHIEPGDKVLEVNGHSMVNIKHEDAVKLFIQSQGKVKLLIHKSIGIILEAAEITDSSQESSREFVSPDSERELKGFSPLGFGFGIVLGCIVVFTLRKYWLSK